MDPSMRTGATTRVDTNYNVDNTSPMGSTTPPSSATQKKEIANQKEKTSVGAAITSGLKKVLAVLSIPLGVVTAVIGFPIFLALAAPAAIIGFMAGAAAKATRGNDSSVGIDKGLGIIGGTLKGLDIASLPMLAGWSLVSMSVDELKK